MIGDSVLGASTYHSPGGGLPTPPETDEAPHAGYDGRLVEL
jgi:hypothetical protein